MTETILLYAAAGLSALAALFSFIAFVRVSGSSARAQEAAKAASDAAASIAGITAAAERTDKTIRDEIARMRNEAEERGKTLRGEVTDSITKLGDGLRKEASELRSGVETRLHNLTEQNGKSAESLRHDVNQRVAALGEGLRGDFSALGTNLAERMNVFTQAQGLQAKALTERLTESLASIEKRLAALTETNEARQKEMREALEAQLTRLREENEKKLEQMRATVEEKLQETLAERLGTSFKQVTDQLETVQRGLGEMQSLAQGVGDLKRVLTNVKTRGGWAEVQLGALIENYLTEDQFIRNAQTGEGGNDRVEFAIRLPGEAGEPVLLPIDAKFPMEDYERLLAAQEAGDTASIAAHLKALETRIRNEAQTIARKYINPPRTTDFAVLYLPTEGLFAEMMRKPALVGELQQNFRVTIAGPTTLTSILNGLQMGFRSLAIQKRSSEVWQVLGAAKAEFQRYGEVWDKLKKHLATAQNTVEEAGRRTRAVERKLRGVEALPGTKLIDADDLSDAELNGGDES